MTPDQHIADAIADGATLEGLADAITRRLAAERLSEPRKALDRSFNPELSGSMIITESGTCTPCSTCGHPTGGPHVVHECSSEGELL